MMAPSRGVCFEGRMFFVYDREAVKKEADPPEDAIVYFYPPAADIHQQITICGQLIGMANFLSGFTGKRSHALIKLKTEKVAMIHVGKYSLALGGTLIEPDSLMSRQLETLYHVFAFYHGSIDRVREMHQDRSSFVSNMSIIWDCYLPFVRHYGDHLPGVFDPVPFLNLPKKAASGFMKASHFLQACQRRRHVLVGCLLYNNSVLCTQLDPDITSRVLLLKPNQSHHPAQPVKTDFHLPFGLRILDCFVTLDEYVTVYDALAQSPYRQQNTANSAETFPDVYSTPGSYERNNSTTETASRQSNVTHTDLQGSSTGDVVENEKLRNESGSQKSDSSERECKRTSQGEGCELVENRGEENPKDSSLPSRAQVELPDGRGSEKHADLEGETVNNGKEKDATVVPKQLVKGGSLQSDDNSRDDKSHSPTSDPALVMEAINVQELLVVECCFQENEGSVEQAYPIITHPRQAAQASGTETELRQSTSEQEDVCSEGGSFADCAEDTESVSEDSPLDRAVSLAAETVDVSATSDLESLCRVLLEDIINEVTAGLETRESYHNVQGAETRLQGPVLFAAGDEISRKKIPDTCATCKGTSLSNETRLCGGDDRKTDEQVSCEEAPSLCRCADACKDSCRDLSVSEANADCVNKSPVACGSSSTRNRSVKFENTIEVFCVRESVGDEHDTNYENYEENKLAEDTRHDLEAQTDSTSSSVTQTQPCVETDSGVSLNNSQTEDGDGATSGAQHQELGESDVIVDATRSSVSHDEELLEEEREEGQNLNQVEGMAPVNLYVQAHSEIVLILLAEPGLKSDQEAIKALWETSLNQLGELEALVKQSVGSTAQSDIKEDFSYLVYDRFEKAMKGNLREPVTQADHVFCDTAKFVHEQFDNCPSLRDVTLRSRSSGVYCKRSLGRETYFQLKGSFRAVPGVPSPRDPTFTLEKRTSKVLLKEHGINVF